MRQPTCISLAYGCNEPPHFRRCGSRVQLGQTREDVEALERKQRTEAILRALGYVAAGAGVGYAYSRLYAKQSEAKARTAALGGAGLALLFKLAIG